MNASRTGHPDGKPLGAAQRSLNQAFSLQVVDRSNNHPQSQQEETEAMHYLFEIASRVAATQADALNKSTLLAAQTLNFVSQALLNVVWSDEARLIFGSTMFYPLLAMNVLFVVSQVVPNSTVKKCKCFCMKKWLAMRKKVSTVLSKFDSDSAVSMVRRTRVLGSARAFVGAVEVLLF
jgi:hypothetical protein